MFRSQSRADPPLTLAERLDRLNNSLQSLAQQVKDAVASAIGTAVAGAVRDGVRGLLGAAQEHDPYEDRPAWRREPNDSPLRDPDQPSWDDPEDDYPPLDRREPASRHQSADRWSNALSVALQAGLTWLRHQPRRRPVLTAIAVALPAGLAALVAGPVVGASAGVLASTAGLLLSADALGPPTAPIAGFPPD
jgi:hypothetical protein